MGLVARLHIADQPLRGLPDPSGGTFDAAGDFDRLLPLDPAEWPMLGRLDQFGDVAFAQNEFAAVGAEAHRLLEAASPGPEERGLRRLLELLRLGVAGDQAVLHVSGD